MKRLFRDVPLPPVHSGATGIYSLITDIPPILMCDKSTVDLFEEFFLLSYLICRLLYGDHSIDDMVNESVTGLLEQFLFMRSEVITNSYIAYLRECHHEV